MQTIDTIERLRAARTALSGRVAFVPTMGALHDGHMALVARARATADHVIVSIFVNPAQFGPNEDYDRYPRQPDEDAAKLAQAGVALLWMPSVATMYPGGYPEGFTTRMTLGPIAERLCGACRPGHFDGVAMVVTKLLNQVQPDTALFGEKDWQQLTLIRRLVRDLDLPVAILGMPTDREADGLARSSRNAYLSAADRQKAAHLPAALFEARNAINRGEAVNTALAAARTRLTLAGFALDYLELVDADLLPVETGAPDARLMVAARIGQVRLIDNLPLA